MLSFIKYFASESDNVQGDNFEGDNNTDADKSDGEYKTDGQFPEILSEVQACLPHESLSCVVRPPRTTW